MVAIPGKSTPEVTTGAPTPVPMALRMTPGAAAAMVILAQPMAVLEKELVGVHQVESAATVVGRVTLLGTVLSPRK